MYVNHCVDSEDFLSLSIICQAGRSLFGEKADCMKITEIYRDGLRRILVFMGFGNNKHIQNGNNGMYVFMTKLLVKYEHRVSFRIVPSN